MSGKETSNPNLACVYVRPSTLPFSIVDLGGVLTGASAVVLTGALAEGLTVVFDEDLVAAAVGFGLGFVADAAGGGVGAVCCGGGPGWDKTKPGNCCATADAEPTPIVAMMHAVISG